MAVFSSSPPQHQVFINSYENDKELNEFVTNLVHVLTYNTSNVSVDMDENKILEVQLKKIEESRIALVIFSGKYTESYYCLRELEKINELRKKGKLVVIPIFFKLDNSTVKGLRGQFGDAFRNQNVEYGTKHKWKKALRSVFEEPGHTFDRKSPNLNQESEIIETIVEDVKQITEKLTLEKSQKKKTFEIKPLEICILLILLFCLQQIVDIRKTLQSEKVKDRKIINSTFTDSSLHSKVKPEPPNIQVFINFYKDQVGKNFISHLVCALERNEVNIIKQKIGEDHNNRFKRIEGCGIAIVVFSSRYPESEYHLDELVKIKEVAEKGRLKVFPIFYNVPISDVKDLKGTFGNHFRDKEIRYKYETAKIKRWKKAVEFVPRKHALEFDERSCDTGGEAYFVRKVVKKVLEVLEDISLKEKKPMFWWFERKLSYA